MKLRIVHVASHEGVYRGGAVQVGRIASAQSRSGHEVAVVAYESPHKTAAMRDLDRSSWARLTKAGVPVIFMNYSGWMGALRLRLEIQRRDAQIVHAHRDPALMACNRALWRMDAPALIAQRGTIKPPPKEVAQILGSPRTRGVVAVANAVRNVLTRSYICPTERVEVIYGSVDMEEFAPRPPKAELRRAAGIPDDAQILGSLSAYRRAKGLELLLKAMKELADSQPRLHALFLGQETEEKLRPVAKELGLEERVHFAGHQPEIADWLSIMDFTVVSATDREGLSGVLRESLAMEVPVISTDCAGNGELVRDRETGLLVPTHHPAALTEAIRWGLEHPDEMKGMARAGREWVQSHCTPQIQVEKLEGVYLAAIGEMEEEKRMRMWPEKNRGTEGTRKNVREPDHTLRPL